LVLTGGAAYAASHLGKNSVGTKQLKNNAVITAKIKNDAVTGAKVNESTLGTVPNAKTATSATTADGLSGGGPTLAVHDRRDAERASEALSRANPRVPALGV
jgi:hypothetical protein